MARVEVTRKSLSRVFYIFLLIFYFAAAPVTGLSDFGIRKAAERDLPHFLESIQAGDEPSFGFENRQEFKKILLGQPYRLVTIDPAALARFHPQDSRHFYSLEVWRFPLVCEGKIRSLLTVAKVRGQWKAVALGATGLAKEIQDFEAGLSDQQQVKRRSILRFFQLGVDFLILSDSDNHKDLLTGQLMPLTSARRFLPSLHVRASELGMKELLIILKKKYQAMTTHTVRGNNE